MLVEVVDLNEIAKAQSTLAKQLRREFPHKRKRTIGYPSGYFEDTVSFATESGNNVSWWCGGPSSNGRLFQNFFGHGDPVAKDGLLIDLQFNFPAKKFTRQLGGAFVRDTDTGTVFLAHRGIVTRGKSRVPQKLLLAEADVTVERVETATNYGPIDLLIVTPINHSGAGREIRDFASELRRAARVVMSREEPGGEILALPRGSDDNPTNWQSILGEYFDEFTGSRTIGGRGAVTIRWKHGKVVRALKEALADRGSCHKSGLIDLALKTPERVTIFEVKSSASTQSVYTGLGQLYLHGLVAGQCFPSLTIERCLVTPHGDLSQRHKSLCTTLGIRLASFREANGNFQFVGL